jgi:uncharacterized membrane protein YphA (DoxX/SURF4 family)
MNTLFLIGRIIFAGYFLYSGVNHFLRLRMMSDYANMKGVPLPSVAIAITGVLLLLGGLSILLGLYPLVGSVLLVVFLLPVSLMMHNFWKVQDPQMKAAEKVNFIKNMALLGGVLMLLALPTPWPFSVPL